MSPAEMKSRTKAYALRVINVVDSLPKDRVSDVLGKQLLRSGTSVGANYRAACRARSSADFVAKMKIVEEECDESIYWMELLVESKRVKENRLHSLHAEGNELLSISVASIKTVRKVQYRNEPRKTSAANRQSSINNRQ